MNLFLKALKLQIRTNKKLFTHEPVM